jgi:hypothetical protein
MHHTKDKGDIACAITIADLTKKGFVVFSPSVTEHCAVDLIAYKNNTMYRIQCKYSSDGSVKNKTSWADKNGNHTKRYDLNDFDYYAIYLSEIDTVVYPSIKFSGIKIRTKPANTCSGFWWWEDFTELTDEANLKTYADFNLSKPKTILNLKGEKRKAIRPEKEVLLKQIDELGYCGTGRIYNVSDNAIRKWVKAY